MNVQMTYLDREYALIKNGINRSCQDILATGQFIGGPEVQRFEENLAEYLNTSHVITCANGTDALLCIYLSLGIGVGDEIIMPAFGYISAYEMAVLIGAEPILVDIDQFYHLDVTKIEKQITNKTKAIVIQQLFGQSGNMSALTKLAKTYNIPIIEDAAQSIGNILILDDKNYHAGTLGKMGSFSFFPTKNLGCYGDGGAITTANSELAKLLRSITRHGQSTKYNHDLIGINSRLDSLQAAILSEKLKYIDEWNDRRQEISKIYDQELKNLDKLSCPSRKNSQIHSFHQYTLNLECRDNLQHYLAEQGIESIIYYPKPIQKQKIYPAKSHCRLKLSQEASNRVLSIPISPFLTELDIEYVIEKIKKWSLN